MPVYNLTVKAGNISKSFNQIADTKEEALAKVKQIARLDPQFRRARVEFPTLAQISTVSLTEDPKFLGPIGIGQTAGTPFDPLVAFRSITEEEQPFATSTPGPVDVDELANLQAAARNQLADRRARELETAIATTGTGTPEDIDAIEAEMFAQAEQNRLDEIRRQAAAAAMATDENDLDASEIEAFAQAERDRLARLRGLGDDETEEEVEVSEAAGADVDIDDLAEFLENNPGATVNPDGSISFAPQTFDSDMIDVTSQIPDPLQLEGFAATDLQDILNIFYANPEQYISEIPVFEDVFNEAGQVVRQRQVGTQQVLSPVAQAALQAFSTQRGAESADVASRFGTATPFGAIAGLGGTADQAISLAELQARAGVTSPFAALGTGSTIEDIGTILRGGLDVEQQRALEGLRARGGLSAEQQLALAGLQARGGISPEQRLAEQRMALLPQLFQTSPQALGGLQRVLGEQQLQQALTPFFSAGSFQPAAPGVDSVPFAQGPSGTNVNINPDLVENVSGRSPFAGGPVTQTISGTTQPVSAVSPGFRPTVGQFQRADLFERGGLEAEAGMAGQELTPFLQDVTPLGASTRPGGLGAQRTTRFTY